MPPYQRKTDHAWHRNIPLKHEGTPPPTAAEIKFSREEMQRLDQWLAAAEAKRSPAGSALPEFKLGPD